MTDETPQPQPQPQPQPAPPGATLGQMAAVIAKSVAAELAKAQTPTEPAPVRGVDRPLADTEEGRMQRYAFFTLIGSAALALGAEYIGVDATPFYGLMGSVSAFLFGNAILGAARQVAKGKAAEADSWAASNK